MKSIFRIIREHEYDSELMRLFVIGGGGCINYIIKMMMGVYESCIEAEKENFVKKQRWECKKSPDRKKAVIISNTEY